jgi:hypothetical protein
MKKLFLILFILFSNFINSQSINTKNLDPVFKILNSIDGMAEYWSSAYQGESTLYKIKTPNQLLKDIDSNLFLPEIQINSPSYKLISYYKTNIKELVNLFRLMGADNVTQYIYFDSKFDLPFEFANDNNKLVFLIKCLSTKNIYNTLKLSPKDRANKVITELILPSLKYICFPLENTKVKEIGLSVVYGSKDFSVDNDYPDNLKAEIVTIIIPIDKCKDYAEGEITEEDLINVSNIYQFDRNSLTGGTKKIKITSN